MAKRKQARTLAPKTEARTRKADAFYLTLNLPRALWLIIDEAARVAGMKPDDIVRAVLALGLVKARKELP